MGDPEKGGILPLYTAGKQRDGQCVHHGVVSLLKSYQGITKNLTEKWHHYVFLLVPWSNLDLHKYIRRKFCGVVVNESHKDNLSAYSTAALGCFSSIQLPLVTHYKSCESAQSSYYITLQWIDDCSACSEASGRIMGWSQRSGVWPPAPPPSILPYQI